MRVDLLDEPAIGRRDDADVDRDALGATDSLDLAAIDRAQQLRLHVEGELADLVEEQRASRGRLEGTRPRRRGTGERAGLVPEQLGLEQVARDGAAIDDDKWTGRARACEVGGLGGEILAGAALALEQHRGVARGGGLEEGVRGAHRDRATDEPAEPIARRDVDVDIARADLEAQLRAAEQQERAVAQRCGEHGHAVDVRAVATAEIA